MTQELSDWFVGAAAKRLSEVEINPTRSHQHEFQATRLVRNFLGETAEPRIIPTRFVYLNDSAEPVRADSQVTYYDARASQPHRSAEYRMYYPDNEVTAAARAGDILVFGLLHDGTAIVAIARDGSTFASQLLWLFDLSIESTLFTVSVPEALEGALTPLDAEVLLDALDVPIELSTTNDVDLVTAAFGTRFPTTAIFSGFAREHASGPDPLEDPDGALLAWWETEYRLFQAFERGLVEHRLAEGFSGETAVEEFLQFSLSVQNRRKSRSGHALENHIEAVFVAHRLPYRRGGITERNSRPDFLLPGQAAYDDLTFPADQLRMLGAKTTAKDRWRQVLSEADRIDRKHLLTLEPAISEPQTSEMSALGLQLVVPRPLHQTYANAQQNWLWTLADFIHDEAAAHCPR